MKKFNIFFALIFTLITSTSLFGQLTGTYTIDSAIVTGGSNFQSFSDFADSINTNGVSGPVTVNVTSGSGPYNQQVVLSTITGVNATNTVKINGNGETLEYDATSTDKRIFGLDGADYVTIDSLVIKSLNNLYGYGIHLMNNADNNAIIRCVIDLSSITSTSSTNSAGILASASITSTSTDGTNASNTLVQDNVIKGGPSGGPYAGIYFNGDGSGGNGLGNDIIGNDITDWYSRAIYIDDQEAFVISGNDISRPTRTISTTQYAVYISSGSTQDMIIEKNRIHNLQGGDLTPTSTAYPIYSSSNDAATGKENLVANNLIYDLRSTGTIYALYNSSSNNYHYYHNTISLDDLTATSGTTRGYYQSTTTTTGIEIKNNIFSIKRGGSGTKHGIYISSSTAITFDSDNNTIHMGSSGSGAQHVGRFGTSDETTLTDWQAVNSSAYDQNSTDADPDLTSLTDLTPIGSGPDETGTNVGIVEDFFGAFRDTVPDMGAIEYTAPVITCIKPSSQTVISMTDTSANVRWNENGTATQWEIEYDTSGFTLGTGMIMIVNTDTFTTITGLDDQTSYDWYIRAVCGPADSSFWVGPNTFTTPCSPLLAPIQENFDGLALVSPYTELPICWEAQTGPDFWDVTNDITNNSHTYLPNIGDHTTGTANYMWIDASSDITANGMESPLIDISGLSTPYAGFWFASNNTTNSINHTIILEAWNGAAWDTIVTERGNFTGWVEVADTLPSSFPNVTKFRISASADPTGTSSTYFYNDLGVDDFFVKEAPQCPAPNALAANSITDSSATLSWTENGTSTQWQIEIDSTGFAQGTGNLFLVNTDTFFTVTGLMAQSTYQWYVRAICAAGDTSDWSSFNSFTTPCQVFNVPFEETFDVFVPTCWDEAGAGDPSTGPSSLGTGNWRDGDYLNTVGNGGGARINLYTNTFREWILSPTIDLSGGPYELSVDAGVTNWNTNAADNMGSDDTVQVLISTDGGASWSDLITWDVNNQPPTLGNTYRIDLSAYTGTSNQFAIWANDGSVNDLEDYDFHIGNFKIDVVATCPSPSFLVSDSISSNDAYISWNTGGNDTSWIVILDTSGFNFDPDSGLLAGSRFGAQVSDTSGRIGGGLTPNTSYDWYVRGICAAGDTSDWVGPASFKTLFKGPRGVDCITGDDSLVFSDDLESMNGWSGSIGSGTTGGDWNYDANGTTSSNTGPSAAHSGSQYVYFEASSGDDTASFISPAIDLSNANDSAELSFWMHGHGGDIGTLTVGVGNSPAGPFTTEFTSTDEFTNDELDPWSNIGVRLDGYVGQTIYIRFFYTAGSSFEGDIALDLIEVTTCIEQPLPYYPIGTINTEDANGVADSLNVDCWTSGTVLGIDLDGNNGISFTISDLSSGIQEGITVFNFNDVSNYVVNEGDSIMVRGTVGQFNGQIQFSPDSILLIDTNATIPMTMMVDSLGEYTESKYVELISDFVLLNGSGPFSFNMDATNGTDTITIRVDSDTDINDSLSANPLVPGDTICGLTGIGGQFDSSNPFTSGYQVFPMRYSDLSICRFVPPAVIPYYPIGTINTEDANGVADSLTTLCFTSGTVIGVDLDGNNGISFYISDLSSGTQQGINVFNFNDVNNYVVTEGDSIMVRGTIDQFNGLTEIIPDSISIIKTNATLPMPRVVTDLVESNEGEWLSLDSLTIIAVNPTGSSGTNYDATTLTGDTIIMRVDNDTDIDDSTTFAVNDVLCNVLAVGSQFDNSNPFTSGYQIFPMRFTDIDTISCQTTSIAELENTKQDFVIYPNPTSGEFVLSTTGFNNASVKVEVRDMSGRIVKSELINNANQSFARTYQMNENSKGIYFISILDGDLAIHKKLIIQ